MKRSEILFTLLLVPADFLAFLLSFLFSYYFRKNIAIDPGAWGKLSVYLQIDQMESMPPLDIYLKLAFFLSLLLVFISAGLGLYKIRLEAVSLKELPKLVVVVSAGVTAIVILSFFLRIFLLPRLIVIFFWFAAIVLLASFRGVLRFIQRALYRLDIGVVRVAVLGSGSLASEVIDSLSAMKLSGYILSKNYQSSQIKQLLEDMRKNRFDQLLIADLNLSDQTMSKLREVSIDHHIRFAYVPNLFEVSTPRVEVKELKGLPIIEVKPTPLDGWGRVEKRVFDLVFSSLALVLLSPVMIVIAILIKILMPGPVSFRHQRLGIGGKTISIIKFRTMKYGWSDNDVVNGVRGLDRFKEYLKDHPKALKEWQSQHKLKDDPRISRFGRFLRRSNLDELPQFINVFFGDLSLVGPRPIVKEEIEKYGDRQGRLFTIKPGLTGLWQVSGRSDLSYEQRVNLDILYVENWSFWLDLYIIIKTIGELIFRRGAY